MVGVGICILSDDEEMCMVGKIHVVCGYVVVGRGIGW